MLEKDHLIGVFMFSGRFLRDISLPKKIVSFVTQKTDQ